MEGCLDNWGPPPAPSNQKQARTGRKMDELLEEDPSESLEYESTAAAPNAGPTNNLEEDNQKNQSKSDADDHTAHRVTDQSIKTVSGQPKDIIPAQANHKNSEDTGYTEHEQFSQKSPEPTDDKTSIQATDTAYGITYGTEQVGHMLASQAVRRTYEQVNYRSSNQPDRRASEQVEHRVPSQADRRASEPVRYMSSSQAERRISEQVAPQSSGQADKRASEQVDHRLFSQAKGRASQQTDDTLSLPSNGGASEDDQHRMLNQETSGQIDLILPSIVERLDKAELILSDQEGDRTAIKFHEVHDQATKATDQQAIYQPDINTDKFMIEREDYNEDKFIDAQADQQENYPSYYKTLEQLEDRIFPPFSNQDKENNYRTLHCKFETGQFLNRKSTLSTDSESPTTSQAFFSDDTLFTDNFQGKDQAFCQKLPSIFLKMDPNIIHEKAQTTEIKPVCEKGTGWGLETKMAVEVP